MPSQMRSTCYLPKAKAVLKQAQQATEELYISEQ